eukprot:TCALIF_02220-PB protein Name:"Similar to scube2 Signal peptide, CUB and EGF-like domain-containing protein 2 (Danio rerio)" AED:0.03 eAED:0.03 QI:0/0.6/0.5/1/0.6/0.83/6/66/315
MVCSTIALSVMLYHNTDPTSFYENRIPANGDASGTSGYAYTTSCLVKELHSVLVPCESGHYWKCDIGECAPCPLSFYQPQWGQTSCWPCPFNTTTDEEGSTQPTDCKRRKCPFYTKDGLGILESPNFPGEYPSSVECHWRVRPGRNKRVLVIISNIQLDEECSDLLTIRKTDRPQTGVVFETCQSHEEPVIFTGHSRNLWVDFHATGNSSGRGFQISFLTIDDELGYLVDAIVNDDKIDTFDKRPGDMSLEVGGPMRDKHLLSRLLLILNPNYTASPGRNRRPSRKKKPIINVVSEDSSPTSFNNEEDSHIELED